MTKSLASSLASTILLLLLLLASGFAIGLTISFITYAAHVGWLWAEQDFQHCPEPQPPKESINKLY